MPGLTDPTTTRYAATLISIVGFLLGLASCDSPEGRQEQGVGTERSGQDAAERGPGPNREVLSGVVYTADEDGASLSMIILATDSVRNVPVEIAPHNIQISGDRRVILATGPLASATGDSNSSNDQQGTRAGQLLILDAMNPDPDSGTMVEVGPDPAHVVIDDEGRFAYVTDMELDRVFVVEVPRGGVVAEIETAATPHGLRLSPDGRELYVACMGGGSLSVIDTQERREVAQIPVGEAPVQVAFTPDGRWVYVSLNDEDAVAVIDVGSRTVIGKIPVGSGPIQLYGTPDSRLIYVANEGTEARPDSTVSVIEVASDSVIETIVSGSGPHGVVVSDDGKYVFVTNVYDNSVSAIEVESQEVVERFSVGKGPNGVTYRPER